MKLLSTNKTAVLIAAILAVSTHQTTARLLEKEQGSDVSKTESSNSILEPLYPDERDLELFDGGTTEDSMRAARMEEPAIDMRAARMDVEGMEYRADIEIEMDKSLFDAGRSIDGTEAARLDGGEYVKLDEMRAAEMRAEDMARMDEMRAEDFARMDMRAEDMARMDMKEARMARARDMGNRDMQENPYGVPLPLP